MYLRLTCVVSRVHKSCTLVPEVKPYGTSNSLIIKITILSLFLNNGGT